MTLPTETNRYIPSGFGSSFGDNTLNDEMSSFSDEVLGYFLGILDENGQITQLRRIESYSGQTLTLDSAWDVLPADGVQYVILYAAPPSCR